MRKILISNLIMVFLLTSSPVFAQIDISTTDDSDTTEETLSVEERVDNLLADINALRIKLRKRKDRRSRTTSRTLRSIHRGIVLAVNSIPPNSCLEKLKVAMDDFYSLADDLSIGISCGPPILPPFLERNKKPKPLTEDCLPPEEEDFIPDQIGGEPFGDVYGLYNEARDLFHVDTDASAIPDACEGDTSSS